MSEAWNQWQGQVIDARFHLEEYLGGNGQSAVFRTQLPASPNQTYSRDVYSTDARWCGESQPLAIKLIADSPNAELQLSRWRMAEDIAHPNLLRILDTGRCRLGQIDLIFAVMEYAEENLAQIVRERPLTVPEAREMLRPLLDALTYLHRRGLVHGHLKPSNILAATDVLKLSTDGVSPADDPISSAAWQSREHLSFDSPPTGGGFANAFGATRSHGAHSEQAVSVLTEPDSQNAVQNVAPTSVYAAPETAFGAWTPATDVWSLGVTLAEVLTQHLPSLADNLQEQRLSDFYENQADPLLPKNVPAELVEIVRGCIRRDLGLRWTIPTIQARLNEQVEAESLPAAAPVPVAVTPAEIEAPPAVIHTGVAQTRVAQPGVPKSSALGVEAPSAVRVVVPQKNVAFRKKAKAALVTSHELLNQARALVASAWTKTSRMLSPSAARVAGNAASAVRRLWIRTASLAPKTGAVAPLVRHFALPAVIAIAALVAIYAGMSLRRMPESSQTEPAPVIPTAQPQPALSTRRPSPGLRKTQPNSGQPGLVQPVSDQQPAARILSSQSAETQQTAASSPQPGVRHIDDGGGVESEPAAAGNPPVDGASSSVRVTQRVLPQVSPSALATIHGTVRVNVRVQVDQSGNVSRAEFASAGPSRYFASLSLKAAQDWKFVPGRDAGPVVLRFEFTRGGVGAYATRAGS